MDWAGILEAMSKQQEWCWDVREEAADPEQLSGSASKKQEKLENIFQM